MQNTNVDQFLTETQKTNLRKLAYFHLGPGCVSDMGFDMGRFCEGSEGEDLEPHEIENVCGTVGCLLGHGQLAGIKADDRDDWGTYGEKFISTKLRYGIEVNMWHWCFAGGWQSIDNTPEGGAKRILWLLEKGLPETWMHQLLGDSPLCYKDWEPEIPEAPKENVVQNQFITSL